MAKNQANAKQHPEENFGCLKITHILHAKYVWIHEIIQLILMKMKMKMKNRSHKYNIKRPRSRHGYKYSKYKLCLTQYDHPYMC